MSRNKDLRITELDFEKIKENYRQYLKSQDVFTDYNFDGSGMDVLLDILAYNTHYNAFYLNSAVNETFLATANSRSNVVKSAQSMSYVPKSKTAPTAIVNLQITVPEQTLINVFGSGGYGLVQLGANTQFSTTIDNKKYIYVNTEPVVLEQVDEETFVGKNVEIRQGIPSTFRYTVDKSNEFQRFVIPDENVDTSTLVIKSHSPELVNTIKYTYYQEVNISSIVSTTPVFFLMENSAGKYEVEFGDGKYGYAPVNNEQIIMNYLVTEGKLSNGASLFTNQSSNIYLSGNLINDANITVATIERSFGGADQETTEAVRYNAPKFFHSQDRAVISNDYAAIIKNLYNYVESVNVWGGEENNPPQFGQVFIAVKPANSLYFTETEKERIKTGVKTKMVSAIRPVVMDPKYTYLQLDIDVKYDSKKTRQSVFSIRNDLVTRIMVYNQEQLERFLTYHYHTRFVEQLLSIDESIETVNVDLRLKKQFQPETFSQRSYTFYFQNPIYYPHSGHYGSITSSQFQYGNYSQCYIKQNANGDLDVVSDSGKLVASNVGQVDYANGIVILSSFKPESYSNSFLEIIAKPVSNDIGTYREFILQIQESDITINLHDVTTEQSLTGGVSSVNQGTDITSLNVTSTAY